MNEKSLPHTVRKVEEKEETGVEVFDAGAEERSNEMFFLDDLSEPG